MGRNPQKLETGELVRLGEHACGVLEAEGGTCVGQEGGTGVPGVAGSDWA
jgi:hypothetical protein